jgi:16S rRNA (cytosine1402-N4)-methyltransferase
MHIPVLLKEVIENLNLKSNKNYIDATLGEGGHSLEILKHILPDGHLLGIDFDPRNLDFVKNRFLTEEIPESNFTLVNDNFKNLTEIVKNQKFTNVSGILFDLGLNSYFLDESKRGFSFRFDEPLDMRFDNKTSINAFDVVNSSTKDELEQILREYGEESFAESISEQIVEARRTKEIKTTYELNDIVFKATPN